MPETMSPLGSALFAVAVMTAVLVLGGGSILGLTIAVHPKRPDMAWFIIGAASFVVVLAGVGFALAERYVK